MARRQPDKRSIRRFPLDLPLSVKYPSAEAEVCQTRDVSSHGVFFYAGTDLLQGSAIEFVMTLPMEITGANPLRVQCRGRVVRVDASGKRRGVAVKIEKYDFVSEEKAASRG